MYQAMERLENGVNIANLKIVIDFLSTPKGKFIHA